MTLNYSHFCFGFCRGCGHCCCCCLLWNYISRVLAHTHRSHIDELRDSSSIQFGCKSESALERNKSASHALIDRIHGHHRAKFPFWCFNAKNGKRREKKLHFKCQQLGQGRPQWKCTTNYKARSTIKATIVYTNKWYGYGHMLITYILHSTATANHEFPNEK